MGKGGQGVDSLLDKLLEQPPNVLVNLLHKTSHAANPLGKLLTRQGEVVAQALPLTLVLFSAQAAPLTEAVTEAAFCTSSAGKLLQETLCCYTSSYSSKLLRSLYSQRLPQPVESEPV